MPFHLLERTQAEQKRNPHHFLLNLNNSGVVIYKTHLGLLVNASFDSLAKVERFLKLHNPHLYGK
jgi:hypothetical protein